jgi:hypothetical protein
MKKFIYLFAFTVMLSASCSKDETVNTCADVPALATAYSTAATTYAASPTPANCNAFKTAGTKYLDALKKCPSSLKAQIDAAQAAIDALTC